MTSTRPWCSPAQELLQRPVDWVAVERLRVRRRIVSETVMLPVTVRREELLIDRPRGPPACPRRPRAYAPPLMVVCTRRCRS